MLLTLLDKLAGKWIDWRTDQIIKNDPELTEMTKITEVVLHENDFTVMSPAIAGMADMLSEFLEENNAKNFVQFEMLPRVDRRKRPILVTVQWRDGKSPALLLAEIRACSRNMIDYFEANVLNFQYEKMKDHIQKLDQLLFSKSEDQ